MLKRIVTVSALSFLVIFSAACASKAAKQDPAPSPAAAAPAASPAAAPSPAVEQAEVPATRQGSFVDGEHPTAGMVTLVNGMKVVNTTSSLRAILRPIRARICS